MFIQNSGIVESNISCAVRILTQAMRYTNITFRKLPFYTVKQEVVKPILLSKLTTFLFARVHIPVISPQYMSLRYAIYL